jgi:hypothetical protein
MIIIKSPKILGNALYFNAKCGLRANFGKLNKENVLI